MADRSFADFIGQLALGQQNLAKLKAITDAESGDFGRAVRDTLVTAQASVNTLVDLLTEAQRLVRVREEELIAEARRQGTLPFDIDITIPDSSGGESSNKVTRWEVLQHGESHDFYAVTISSNGDGKEAITGYVDLPADSDLPEVATLPALGYKADPGSLEFLNNEMEPWGVRLTMSRDEAEQLKPATAAKPPRKKAKKKAASKDAAGPAD